MIELIESNTPPRVKPGSKVIYLEDGTVKIRDASGNDMTITPDFGTPVKAVAASGTITGTTIAADDTVTIGGLTYTFVDALTDDPETVPFEVLVGASDSDSLDNLIAAINGAAGEGTTYGTGTTEHPSVTASAGAGDTVAIAAQTAGVNGNAIDSTSALTDGGFAAVTLTGGVDGTVAKAGTVLFDASATYFATTDTTRSDSSGWRKSTTSAI